MKRALTLAGAMAGTFAVAAIALSTPAISKSGTTLTGTLELTAGKAVKVHGKSEYTGTYFRMLYPSGTDVYFHNGSSSAPDKTYTFLRPGTNGGLELGHYQPPPSPAFTSGAVGNARASRITQPQGFEDIKFSISTAAKDAQSGAAVPAPSLVLNGDKLTGNLSAWTAEWNSVYFNQGAPKPNNSYPGLTKPVTGTYNPKTGAFTITWYSQIVGGPFANFTGFWHLQGHLKK
jgi:hypothetical protein